MLQGYHRAGAGAGRLVWALGMTGSFTAVMATVLRAPTDVLDMSGQEPYSEGDIVRLKSGGPKMTVMKVRGPFTDGEFLVDCKWFSGAKVQEGSFQPSALELVGDED